MWDKVAAEEMQFSDCWYLRSEIAGHDGPNLRNTH